MLRDDRTHVRRLLSQLSRHRNGLFSFDRNSLDRSRVTARVRNGRVLPPQRLIRTSRRRVPTATGIGVDI